jgi:hypothetical protein
VWVFGRVWYAVAYLKDPAKRGPGFMLASAGWLALLVMGVWGLLRALLAG